MKGLEPQLDDIEPELARRIRDSASRAGLQAHDPAARMIAEMWVAVAALEKERHLLTRDIDDLARRVRDGRWYLLALVGLGTLNLLVLLALLPA